METNSALVKEKEAREIYQTAVKEYADQPLNRIQDTAARAVENGRYAVKTALDKISDMTYSAVTGVTNLFKKKN